MKDSHVMGEEEGRSPLFDVVFLIQLKPAKIPELSVHGKQPPGKQDPLAGLLSR